MSWEELTDVNPGSLVRLLRIAANVIYRTDKYGKRGEFGELLLHAAIRQVFNSVPAISKLYYKDSPNETVKGFDAVHVVASDRVLELWLGEAKFYTDIGDAIAAVVRDLASHTSPNYLRTEFTLILNKIDDRWPHSDKLRKLLDPNTSLDEIFDAICIPVLLTYDSSCVADHVRVSEEYEAAFLREVESHAATFALRNAIRHLRIHLFLVPLASKSSLVAALNTRLAAAQAL